jgi:hypothetical protein
MGIDSSNFGDQNDGYRRQWLHTCTQYLYHYIREVSLDPTPSSRLSVDPDYVRYKILRS